MLNPSDWPRHRFTRRGSSHAHDVAAAVAAYGPNLTRLREIKKRYDPKNVFHLNVNILPAS
jgi:FAD/FMN-containing dehydrogenase